MIDAKKVREQIVELRSFDECSEPADGWWVAYNDLLAAANTLEALLSRNEALEKVAVAAQNIDNLWGREGLSNMPADIALMDDLAKALQELDALNTEEQENG